MTEIQRQQWIGIALDLMVEYHRAQDFVCSELNYADHPGVFLESICERVALAIGNGATAEAVHDALLSRLKLRPEGETK